MTKQKRGDSPQRIFKATAIPSNMLPSGFLAGLLLMTGTALWAETPTVKDILPPADPATLPAVPAIRPGQARDMTLDGQLNEGAWGATPSYTEFGLDTGEGPSDFPTRARFLYADRTLWIGLECDLPRPADGGELSSVLEKERIEVFLDSAGGRRTSYHLGLTPSGQITIPGMETSAVAVIAGCVASRRETGYTLEIRLQLDGFDQLGAPNKDNIGINIARDSVKRWASLNGVVGQGQRPEQFWTLLLGSDGAERPPQLAYQPLFRDGADVPALASAFVADWNTRTNLAFPGRPLMEVRLRQLTNVVARSRKDRWGSPVPLRTALFRGWRAQRDLLPQVATSSVARAIEAALMPGVAEAFPATAAAPANGWRECAIISTEDDTAQPYALFVPPDAPSGQRLPLVVYLHGSSLGSFSDGLIFERYQPPTNFLFARVNARRCKRYGDAEKREINQVIDDISARWPVDTNRVSLLGFSAGAFAAADLSVEQPERFSAVAAAAGRFRYLNSGRHPGVHVLAAWGRADEVVPFKPAEASALFSEVRQGGHEVCLFALPVTGHAVPMAGFEFWLASRTRGGEKPAGNNNSP